MITIKNIVLKMIVVKYHKKVKINQNKINYNNKQKNVSVYVIIFIGIIMKNNKKYVLKHKLVKILL